MIVLLLLLVVSWMVVRRLLNEISLPLSLGLSYCLASLLLMVLANQSLDKPLVLIPLLLLGLLALLRCPQLHLEWPELSRATRVTLLFLCLAVVAYTNLYQSLFPDPDYWIHFPLQHTLRETSPPVVHPFFPEIRLNGHYGRDLLIAAVARHAKVDIFSSIFWQNTLSQLASLLLMFGLAHRSTRSEFAAILLPVMTFFGVHVGCQIGLFDCFQNNNALAYLISLACLHCFSLVYLEATWSRVVIASFVLGSFALVYETHFGLMGLVLGVGLCVTRMPAFAVVGCAALVVACLQGGPITELVRNRISPPQQVASLGEASSHQVITVTFPKKQLFQLQLGYGQYQRLSTIYTLLPAIPKEVTAIAPGTPYRPIWSWDVLKIHWLATFFAPLSLFLLIRQREPLGLAFWSFGFFAFLTPAVVHFGPVYEFEYFRWQFAAGFGFAGALGLAVGGWLDTTNKGTKALVLSCLLLTMVIPSLLLVMPRLMERAKVQGRFQDLFWPQPEARWLLLHSNELGGFNYFDLKAAYQLRALGERGQTVLVNDPHSSRPDMHLASTLVGVTGLRVAGHALPRSYEVIGTPPFHHNAANRVFWERPSQLLLRQLQVDWLLLRPGATHYRRIKNWMDENYTCVWRDGDYRIYQVELGGTEPFPRGISARETNATTEPGPLPSRLFPDQVISFPMPEDGFVWAWGFTPPDADEPDLAEVVVWSKGEALALTPPSPDRYQLRFYRIEAGWMVATPVSVEAVISVESPDEVH